VPAATALPDVEGAFARIPVCGGRRAAQVNDLIPNPDYRASVRNWFGFRNHVQGIGRVPDTNYVVLSGSDPGKPASSLFVVRLGSGRAPVPSISDRMATGAAYRRDEVVASVMIDRTMWHAGGLAMLDGVLAVPIYGGRPRRGRVVFYDLADPEHPRRLGVEIDRPGRKAYAAALTRLPNGRVLAAVFAARDRLPKRIELYLSRSHDLAAGFQPAFVTWLASDVGARNGQTRNFGDFQGLSFVSQTDGRLYLIGFHNSLPSLPMFPGRDYADLYEVVFPSGTTTALAPVLATPSIVKVANRQFYCKDGYCNMDASAGLDVDLLSGRLEVYAAAPWVDGDQLKFTVYGSAGSGRGEATSSAQPCDKRRDR
jgi:hypothetical protein